MELTTGSLLVLQRQVVPQRGIDGVKIRATELAEWPEQAPCMAPCTSVFDVQGIIVTTPRPSRSAAMMDAALPTRITGRALSASDPRTGSRSARKT